VGYERADVGRKACWTLACQVFAGEKAEEGVVVFVNGGGEDCGGVEEMRCFVVDLLAGKEKRNHVAGGEVVPGFDVRVYFLVRWEEGVAVDALTDVPIQFQKRKRYSIAGFTAVGDALLTG